MYAQHVQQAHLGCDFDFLETRFGSTAGEPEF
jgi:dihydroxy-acid dehydratase